MNKKNTLKDEATKTRLIKNSTYNTISSIVLRIVQILQGIFVANILGPTLYGVKDALNLIFKYGSYIHLGSLNAFYKKRLQDEKDNIKERNKVTNLTFSFILLISFIFIIASVIAFFLLPYSITIRLSIIFIAFAVFISLEFFIFRVIIISKNDFKSLFKLNIFQALLVFISIVFFTYLLKVLGFFIGYFFAFVFVLIYAYKKSQQKIKFVFNIREYVSLIKEGFIVFVLGLNFLLFLSIDRLFILFAFGKAELGYYAVALFFANLLYFFKSTLFVPLLPHIYQKRSSIEDVIKYIIKPLRYVFWILFYFAFLIAFLFPFVIFVLPKYSPGLKYVYILILSIVFFPGFVANRFISINKEKVFLYYTIIFVLFSIVLNTLVVLFKLPSTYIALATLISFFLYGNTMNFIAYKEILGSKKEAFKEILKYLWPLGYALIGYALLWLLAHFILYNFLNYYVVKIIQALLFTIWYLPILLKINKELSLSKSFSSYIRRIF